MTMEGKIKKEIKFIHVLMVWAIYFFSHLWLKKYFEISVFLGISSLIFEVALDLVIVVLSFLLWKKSSGKNKTIFFLFFLSFILALITDGSYNLIANVFGITHFTSLINILFDIPFLGYLILQLAAWIMIFNQASPNKKKVLYAISYVPIAAITVIILSIFIFGISWEINPFSTLGIFIVIETLLQVACFIFALLCLAMATKNHIRFIAIGVLVITSTDFIVHFSILAKTLVTASSLETIWVFGLLCLAYGMYLLNKTNEQDKKWLSSINSIQAQCAFWSFLLCIASALILFAASYIFTGEIIFKIKELQYVPSVLIAFSIIAVLVSSFFAKTLSAPFQLIEGVVNSYIDEKTNNIEKKNYKSNIYDFEGFENFIKKAFDVLREKNKAQEKLFKCATQVAHDIRTPLSSLKLSIDSLPTLPEAQSSIIRNSLKRINDTANNLLNTYKENKIKTNQQEKIAVLVEESIDEILPIAHQANVHIVYDVLPNERNSFVKVCANEFKMALINIINNSIEAYEGFGGTIDIVCRKEKGNAVIEIIDHGKGIPENMMNTIFEEGFSFDKKNGTGEGLYIAKKIISSFNGDIKILSKRDEGTKVIFTLPISEKEE